MSDISAPIRVLENQMLEAHISEQTQKWDVETHLIEFGRALDTLDVKSEGLPDDPRTANAIISVHDKLR